MATLKDSSTEKEPLLERVTKDIEEWRNYSRPYRNKWQKYWKLWDNERIKQQYHGDSDSFDPMTFQMVESNVDNVYSSRPKMAFVPRNRYQETDTNILNGMWDRNWDDNNMDYHLPIMGREATNTGNLAAFGCWEDNEEGGYMRIVHVPMNDVILDAAAKDQFSLRFGGYRRLVRLGELEDATRYDAEKGEWVPRYKNLDKVQMYGQDGDLTDKQLKDMLTGSTLSNDGKREQLEVTYMIYLDKIIEVANRSVVIFETDNPYHKDAYEIEVPDKTLEGDSLYDDRLLPEGIDLMAPEELEPQLMPAMKTLTVPAIKSFIPIAMHSGYKRGSLLIAKGDVETFADSQEDLNDSINELKDNIAYNVKNVVITEATVQPEEADELADAQPGSVIRVTGGPEAVKWMDKPDMSTAALAEIQRTKQSIRDTARVDEVVQGVSDDDSDKTATEIKAQVAQASGGFRTKGRNLEAGFYKQLGEMYLKMVQIFIPGDQVVRVNGRNGVEFQLYESSKYWGLFDIKPTLETNANAKKEQEAQKALALHAQFQGSPYWNQRELEKMVAKKAFDIDDDELEALMMDPGAMPIDPAMMGMDPTMGAPGDMAPPPAGING